MKKREVILKRDSYLCQECKRYGKTTQANTVHHIYPLENYPEYKLTNGNLLSLCMSCHGEFHDRVTNALTDKGMRWKERTVLPPPL
ncbi:HNH endonuclease [Sporosarcina newyorkensis]|uniref:HNH endonuclease n=1 Tax=Sporosarcina newyorkensis TaxID=759851 RepID=UPI003D025347